MFKIRLMIIAVAVAALTLGLSGLAFAAPINCGDCHGAETKSPAWEAPSLPMAGDLCSQQGRGLHGVHNNYSSQSYATGANAAGIRGNCNACHEAVPFSAAGNAPTLKHNQGGFATISGYNNGTWNSLSMTVTTANAQCSNSCHRNNAAVNLPAWGNYTSHMATYQLTCSACHDDITVAPGSMSLSPAHPAHLGNGATILVGSGVSMTAANNAGCVNCHPNNTSDLWKNGKSDTGNVGWNPLTAVKAYPHAIDGTNVVNAVAQKLINWNNTVNGTNATLTLSATAGNTTCTNSCHPRQKNTVWGGTIAGSCSLCHYYAATGVLANNTGTGMLTYAHSAHFAAGVGTCTNCHVNVTTGAHVTQLPIQALSAPVDAQLTLLGYNSGTGKCSSSGCHGRYATPSWTSDPEYPTPLNPTVLGCAGCHAYPGSGTNWGNGVGNAAYNGHTVQYATTQAKNTHLLGAASYAQLTDNYTSVVKNAAKCGMCHYTANYSTQHMAYPNGPVPLNTTNAGYAQCGGNFVFNQSTSFSRVTCSSVSCHSGKKTPNWY